ncbi:type IV pilin protein [Pseudoalteromonas sp. NGC95]|uniref:type IV pilin protein n=1 Tax=Pseudoalteromonas sp. NGC95 TaxID=2792051 RepID=UPI0018CE0E4E|nr:prepilin-type N-terminal cleavage/methylation domain-containing protein [Pseudoalteromonas sp. NGC95]MBH0017913.1 prepilin-type N-terminal cleavage/methylation domain-containing protein [Pseudoalteromonas sp. NGC95]
MVNRQSGLSLIELLIVVSIVGVLALVTVPFTQSWLYEAQLNDAKSQLSQAYTQAKALALRNPENVHGEHNTAACVNLLGSFIQVRQPSGTGCSGGVTWQGNWPIGVGLVRNNVNLTVVFINNRGAILINNQPSSNLEYILAKGNVSYEGMLY